MAVSKITPEHLSTLLLTSPTEDKLAIVDVRDSDHIGGHIKSSRHVPSGTIAYAAPGLVRTLRRTERVVFHCALSQERGPSAAQRYIRERQRLLGPASVVGSATWDAGSKDKERDEDGTVKIQEVYVLEGGFVKWQQKYGSCPTRTTR